MASKPRLFTKGTGRRTAFALTLDLFMPEFRKPQGRPRPPFLRFLLPVTPDRLRDHSPPNPDPARPDIGWKEVLPQELQALLSVGFLGLKHSPGSVDLAKKPDLPWVVPQNLQGQYFRIHGRGPKNAVGTSQS